MDFRQISHIKSSSTPPLMVLGQYTIPACNLSVVHFATLNVVPLNN